MMTKRRTRMTTTTTKRAKNRREKQLDMRKAKEETDRLNFIAVSYTVIKGKQTASVD